MSAATQEAILARLAAYADRLHAKKEANAAASLVWKQGSQVKTRFYGAWNVKPLLLPCRVELSLLASENGEGTRVHAVMEEAMGFGFMDSKAKEAFDAHLSASVARLRAVSEGAEIELSDTGTLTEQGSSAMRWIVVGLAIVLLNALLRSLR